MGAFVSERVGAEVLAIDGEAEGVPGGGALAAGEEA